MKKIHYLLGKFIQHSCTNGCCVCPENVLLGLLKFPFILVSKILLTNYPLSITNFKISNHQSKNIHQKQSGGPHPMPGSDEFFGQLRILRRAKTKFVII